MCIHTTKWSCMLDLDVISKQWDLCMLFEHHLQISYAILQLCHWDLFDFWLHCSITFISAQIVHYMMIKINASIFGNTSIWLVNTN